ncbi:MAG: hypothetical protein PS018_08925 [bacterium]|nr:hypothetical protein [bacterium]
MTRRTGSKVPSDSSSDQKAVPDQPTFEGLLTFHLARGTRPDRTAKWSKKDFAADVGVSVRSLNLWENGEGPGPGWLPTILRVLFGSNPSLQHFREEMSAAFYRRSQQGDLGLGDDGRRLEGIETIPADPSSVYQFIQRKKLFGTSTQIDLWLYTAETLMPYLRSSLTEASRIADFKCTIRALIKNPQFEADEGTRSSINASIFGLQGLGTALPNLKVSVKLCDETPVLRLLSFRSDASQPVGLLGLYYYEAEPLARGFSRRIIGAENNEMMVCEGRDTFSAKLLARSSSRFELRWSEAPEVNARKAGAKGR